MSRGPDRVLDEYLVVLSQGGSRTALVELVRRWSPRLLRHAARMLGSPELAEDATQETWRAAVPALARLEDPARFRGWIYAIATRKCADAIRGRQRTRRLGQRVEADAAVNGAHVAPPGGDSLDLAAAIARLPLEQRLAVSLHYGEDLGMDEIAEVLRIPAGTVKSRLHAARHTLKTYLEGTRP